jgi:protein-tyrosine phosphatase
VTAARYRICFVCLGNICRSPTAEGVMRALLSEHGLADRVDVDSAGTGAWHLGESPDPRSVAAAARRGIALAHAARKVTRADFERFDLLLAMDAENAVALARLAPTRADRDKVRLLRSFDPSAPAGAEVPDPWYGGDHGFEIVLDVCTAACEGLLVHVRGRLA